MNADVDIEYDSLDSLDSKITRAHRYFREAVTTWLGAPEDRDHELRASQLTDVLQSGLQLVSIDLVPSEDSQEIFETLNARGTPLTASDLVRNFVFQRLEAEGADSKAAYEKDWPFESKFWEAEVSVGRQLVSRSSLFLNQWLISRTGDEISPMNTFASFKSYVEHTDGISMRTLLPEIRVQADSYQAWTEEAARPDGNLDEVAMAVYRMRSSGIEIMKPLLIWLDAPLRSLPRAIIGQVVAVVESWVYRRQLLRLSNSDLGRIIAEIIRTFGQTPANELPHAVSAYLSRLNVTSTYWPGDSEMRAALLSEPVYRRYPRGRLRMFLEAVEDSYRSETGQPQVIRGKLPIEHVLPQKWQDSWPIADGHDPEERAKHVHRLGNLTLLTSSLNSKVSNGPWARKRPELLKHNTMTMTGRIIEQTEHRAWDEDLIDARSEELIDALIRVWPTPTGHVGTVVDPQSKAGDWIEIKHLVEAKLLMAGQLLSATHRDFEGVTAQVLPNGELALNGKTYSTPSAAGKALRGRATNGWYFWGLGDGRRLRDVRSQFIDGQQRT